MMSSSGFAPERGRLRGFNSPIALNTSGLRSLVRKNCVRACYSFLAQRVMRLADLRRVVSTAPNAVTYRAVAGSGGSR